MDSLTPHTRARRETLDAIARITRPSELVAQQIAMIAFTAEYVAPNERFLDGPVRHAPMLTTLSQKHIT